METVPDDFDEVPKKTWNTPSIEDFGISTVTQHFFASGVDNYEADNPVNYGVIS